MPDTADAQDQLLEEDKKLKHSFQTRSAGRCRRTGLKKVAFVLAQLDTRAKI